MRSRIAATRTILAIAAIASGVGENRCAGQAAAGVSMVCVIDFNQDARLPARVEDSALSCLDKAKTILAGTGGELYLVGTADRVKDNQPGHGHTRTEQDMTGDDLRYADVAAYRAINTKAYLVRWMGVDPKRVVPLTSYEDGQRVEFYLVRKGASFQKFYSKKTAPILSRPCTVKPCAVGPEEFLIAQQRDQIPPRQGSSR